MIRYANHFTVIFLNINLCVRNEKMVLQLKGCTYKITHIVTANIFSLPHLIPNYGKDMFLYSIVIMLNYPIYEFININVNIRNEPKKIVSWCLL